MFFVETITYRGNVVFTERERCIDFENASERYFIKTECLLQGSMDSEFNHGADLTDMIEDRVLLGVLYNVRARYNNGEFKKHSLIYIHE